MKNYFILFVLIITVFGCQKLPTERWDYFPSEINLGEYNHLDYVKLKKGKTVLVHIEEDPNSGLSWKSNSMDGCNVSISTGELSNGSSEGDSNSTTLRNFEVTGNANGVCLVEFNQQKGDEKPVQKKAIYFIVE